MYFYLFSVNAYILYRYIEKDRQINSDKYH